MGGLDEIRTVVHRPRSLAELRALFEQAGSRTFSLVGARHSFDGHNFPQADGEAIDTTGLDGAVRLLETDPRGCRWARVPGSFSFERLAAEAPGWLPRHPPTSDLITQAGALAACTHDSIGFFADHVRRFTVLTPDGALHDCRPDAAGLAGELYRLVPGSFGLLGVVLDLELRLYPSHPSQCVSILVRRGRYADDPGLEQLLAKARSENIQGAGLFVYGVGAEAVSFEAHVATAADLAPAPPLLLTDDATTRNVYLQALASLAPWLAKRISLRVLRDGRRFRAPLYGHAFFQRSYGRAHALLAGGALAARALRRLGLNPRLPVVHQSYVVPTASMAEFLAIYFGALERYPDLVPRLEQQDFICLPEARWPLHGAFGMKGGAFLLTTSIGVVRGGESERRGRALLGEVAALGFEAVGAKTLLLKHTHGALPLLRSMHAGMIQQLLAAKAKVDPRGLLRSQLLEKLIGVSPAPAP